MILICDDCGFRFDEEDAKMVRPDETDGVAWYERIPACPVCRSTSVFEASEYGVCIRCGGEAEEGSEYCEHCRDDLWG